MSELQKRLHKKSLGGLPPKFPGSSASGRGRNGRNYNPVKWDSYFTSQNSISLKDGSELNYYSLDPASIDGDVGKRPVLFLLHGGGYSGLTWGPFVKHLRQLIHFHGIYALDLRGHGQSVDDIDISMETMQSDVLQIIEEINKDGKDVILVGHSMGGALAVNVGLSGQVHNLSGLVVIDVVEGTAMDSLHSMQNFLKSRPSSFPSISNAVEWAVRSGQVRNVESARVSMPGQIKNKETNRPATLERFDQEEIGEKTPFKDANAINEEENSCPPPPPPQKAGYTWRIDLSKTDRHWRGWFSGLSSKFIDVSASKLLLLAGVDRLDKDLTVGQMQGKFQMQILPQAGHAVHEDVPDRVAQVIASFLIRNKFTTASSEFEFSFPAC